MKRKQHTIYTPEIVAAFRRAHCEITSGLFSSDSPRRESGSGTASAHRAGASGGETSASFD